MDPFFSTLLRPAQELTSLLHFPSCFILTILAIYLWWWNAPLRFKIFVQRNIQLQTNAPRLPPGSAGIPFLGHMPFVLLSSGHDKLASYSEKETSKYGEMFCFSLPPLYGRKNIRLNGEEAVSWSLSLENRGLVINRDKASNKLLGQHSVAVLKNSAHTKMRSLLGPIFQPSYLREYVNYIDEIVRNHFDETWSPVKGIDKKCEKDTRHVNVRDNFKSLTFKIICDMVLGLDLEKDRDEVNEIQSLLKIWFKGLFMPTVKFPGNPYFPALDAREKLKSKILDIVKRHRSSVGRSKNDVMARLLGPLNSDEKKTVYLDDDQIFDQILILIFAGSDTTSSCMTFILKRLTENPSALNKLQEEHLALMMKKKESSGGENRSRGSLEWDDIIGSLPYTNNVIYESLRLNPPVAGSTREAERDLVYNKKYLIPKGYSVTMNYRANDKEFHHHDAFDPGRFDSDDGALKKKSLKAFGGGKRMCLGYRMAIAELSITIHYLVLNYSWEKAPEWKAEINYLPVPMPTDGYPIVVKMKKFP